MRTKHARARTHTHVHTQVYVEDTLFEDNYSSSKAQWVSSNFFPGGAVAIVGETELTLKTSVFARNGADRGGAMAVRGNNTVVVEDCRFEDNLSGVGGGGVFFVVSGGIVGEKGGG